MFLFISCRGYNSEQNRQNCVSLWHLDFSGDKQQTKDINILAISVKEEKIREEEYEMIDVGDG